MLAWGVLAVSRIFTARRWRSSGGLAEQRPELANEIFLDIDPESGLQVGARWKGHGAQEPRMTDLIERPNARDLPRLGPLRLPARRLATKLYCYPVSVQQ